VNIRAVIAVQLILHISYIMNNFLLSAMMDLDYEAIIYMLTFSSDQMEITVPVNITDDLVDEDIEQFSAELTSMEDPLIVTLDPSMARIDISDNDGKHQLRIFVAIIFV